MKPTVSDRLLISPVRLGHSAHRGRARDKVIHAVLKLATSLSHRFFYDRGTRFACGFAGRLLARAGQVSFQLGGGGVISVSQDDTSWLIPLLLNESYELDLDHFLRKALTTNDVFLDCGANIGLWSIAAAQIIRDPGRVVAVEAASRTFSRLSANWTANGQSFTLLRRAVSDVTGASVSFFTSVKEHVAATLVAELSPKDSIPESATTISLLDLIQEQTPTDPGALIFVKLDIEGMERQVLATLASKTEGRVVVLFEDHGRDKTHVSAFLLDRGFRVIFLADDGSVEQIRQESLYRLDVLKDNTTRGYNLLALEPRGAGAIRLLKLYPHLDL